MAFFIVDVQTWRSMNRLSTDGKNWPAPQKTVGPCQDSDQLFC